MAKLAVGICDDVLTTTFSAIPQSKKILLCPAMNTQMWDNPVTQRNLRWLQELARYDFCDPVSKRLACGDIGVGGLAEVETIMKRLNSLIDGEME